MQLGPAEILVVLVIALLVFGPNKLPEVGRQVGRAYREVRRFQRSLTSEMSDVFADDISDGAAPPPTLPPKRAVSDAPDGLPAAPDELPDAPHDTGASEGPEPEPPGSGASGSGDESAER
ncbi:MAG TPA: twin-arginine translocase TatA/TatE family subunit [Acidimicrobiia bacterium]|nr:twin-arginine translocase TatA/TatE family subunit [Acidimicrobiia bacterium]